MANAKESKAPAKAAKRATAKPPLLSGGNPQIAKADGDAPVQAYIAAMPGWKRDVGRRLDALIVRTVPGVRKGVKWNSPLYGIEGQGWFLGLHVFTHYVKVTFFRGAALRPALPGGTVRSKDARWIDIREGDALDEKQIATWVKQAVALPGFLGPGQKTDEQGANAMKKSATTKDASPSHLIDARIKELGDWRGETLARVRALIKQAVPAVVEEWKWRGVPCWYHDGLICTGETYKNAVKLTFAKGAALKDPSKLFNASLEGNTRRAIDLHEGDEIDAAAFKTLIRAAAALNSRSD